jgi:hypothetical protein
VLLATLETTLIIKAGHGDAMYFVVKLKQLDITLA